MYKRMGERGVVDVTPLSSHIALFMPKNCIFINELCWKYNVSMLRFIVSTICIPFSECASLETLEYYSHMVIWIFSPIGHIHILSIGNEHSFRGV